MHYFDHWIGLTGLSTRVHRRLDWAALNQHISRLLGKSYLCKYLSMVLNNEEQRGLARYLDGSLILLAA